MPSDVPRFAEILRLLNAAEVDYVIIGGVALAIHGSSKATFDLDVMYRRNREQAERITQALAQHAPRPRGFPDDLPYQWHAGTLLNATISTLRTDLGDLDLLAEADGSGGYDHLSSQAETYDIEDLTIRVASLQDLLNMKRAANRPKDDVHIAELEDWLAEAAADQPM